MGSVNGAAIFILICFIVAVHILSLRTKNERRKRQEHEEWMTQVLASAAMLAEGESGFLAAVKRRAKERTLETSESEDIPNETAIESGWSDDREREPFFGKGKELIFDWDRIWDWIKGLKLSRKKLPDLSADAQRYRIYGLYVVLILAGVLFIPEAREWAGARVSEAAQWFSLRYAEGQATGSKYATVARALVVDHFTVIWQSAALLVLAGLFLKFGKRAGIVGAVGCVLVTGYLGTREYVETQIAGLRGLASLMDRGTMPSPSPVPSPYRDTKNLCGRALLRSLDGWDHSVNYEADVAEAQKRGLTIESCRVALGLSSSAFSDLSETILCERALASSTDRWDLSSSYEPYAKAAQSRGMTVASCRQALGIQDVQPTTRARFSNMEPSDLCRAALNAGNSDWDSNYPDAVGVAISRNFTVLIRTQVTAYFP